VRVFGPDAALRRERVERVFHLSRRHVIAGGCRVDRAKIQGAADEALHTATRPRSAQKKSDPQLLEMESGLCDGC